MEKLTGYRTILANVIALAFSLLPLFGYDISLADQGTISTGVLAVINIALRLITKTPVGQSGTSKNSEGGFITFNVILAILSICSCMMIAVGSFAATASNEITCTMPTTRADGSALAASEVAKITAYATRCDKATTKIEAKSCKLVDSFTMPSATCETKYELTATDVNGIESAKATPVAITNTISPPSPPSGVAVQVSVTVNVVK